MNKINKMYELDMILIIVLIFSLVLSYLSFHSKKTDIQLVNDMGIGYNLGITFNCGNIIEEQSSEKKEELLGTTFPTKNIIKEIRKNGFKTIRFQILYKNNYIYNNGTINSELINKIKELTNLIRKLNMYLIFSIKHTNQFWDSEGINAKDKYINFWKQIAHELKNYDEHLIFESMYEMGYLAYLDKMYNYYENKEYYLSQDFINTIRDSEGFNNGRLLIIPMLTIDFELNYFTFDYYEYKIPKDPYNKLAISIYYYFPSQDSNPMDIFDPINLYDNYGDSQQFFFPVTEWGSSMNFGNIISNYNYIKQNFTDKGFPIIIDEVGILNDYIKI